MRFQFYTSELDQIPKISVDGTVPNSIHFSHWEGNETPAALRADTSTEITLNLVASPQQEQYTHGIELVTNNHFDTDGVLSVWTILNGERALGLREELIGAAEAGDFNEFRSEDAVKASIVIQGADQAGANNDTVSPLARRLSDEPNIDDARSYELILPEVEKVLTRINDYEPLWREAWQHIAAALDSFESGHSKVTEITEPALSLITLSPSLFGPAGFTPGVDSVPFIAVSNYARGHLFLIAAPNEAGWVYRLDYPYYSWAETVVRPRIAKYDLAPVLTELNELELKGGGEDNWKADQSEMTSAIKVLGRDGMLAPSSLTPDVVAAAIQTSLKNSAPKAMQVPT